MTLPEYSITTRQHQSGTCWLIILSRGGVEVECLDTQPTHQRALKVAERLTERLQHVSGSDDDYGNPYNHGGRRGYKPTVGNERP